MNRITWSARGFALLAFLTLACSGSEGESLETPEAEQTHLESEVTASAQALTAEQEEVGPASHTDPLPHFQYTHVTWHPVGPRTAEVSVLSVFRRDDYPGSGPDGRVVTGDIFTTSGGRLRFGDGVYHYPYSEYLTYEAIDHDVDQGWVLVRAVTEPGPGPLPGTGVTVTEIEPNATFDTATPLNLGDDALTDIGTAWEDHDFFRFTLTEQKRISLGARTPALPSTSVVLYSSSGEPLADTQSPDLYPLDVTLPAGTYYFDTFSWDFISGSLTLQLREIGELPARPITYTYMGEGPYTASFEGCCYDWREAIVSTQVRFDLPNSSPVSTLQPLVTAPVNTPDFSFQIPATDADGDSLTFRLASSAESGLDSLPPGLSVGSSGLVTWNTTRLPLYQWYPVQVVIEEHREGQRIGSAAVAFLLRAGPPTNHPPVCHLERTDYEATPSQTLLFDISATDPDLGEELTIEASGVPPGALFWKSMWPPEGSSQASSSLQWKPAADLVGSSFTVNFTVSDLMGNTTPCAATIHVVGALSNHPPVADAGPDQLVSEGTQVMLDGRASSDPDGDRLTYDWSSQSGTPYNVLSDPTASTPTFTPLDSGTYTFGLAVSDGRGGTSFDRVTVTVSNVAPTLSVEGAAVAPGTLFTSVGTLTDPGADSFTGTVDYGDGSGPQPLSIEGRSFNLGHVYEQSGTYSVTISVQDDDGGVGTATAQVVVTEAAPVVLANGGSADEGSLFTAPGEFISTGGTSWTATVNYGDGSGWQPLALDGQSFTLNHAYADDGFYYVSIRVTDDTGLTGSGTVAVQVFNVAPQPSAPDIVMDEGTTFTTTVSVSDPGADRWTAWVYYGDGTGEWLNVNADGTFTLTHRYDFPGQPWVEIVVYDDDGGEGFFMLPVTVNNLPPVVELSTVGPAYEGEWWIGSGTLGGVGLDAYYAYATVDYGDGSGPESLNSYYNRFWLSHRYEQDGVYTVTVTVVEEDGSTGTASAQVVVQNAAPQVLQSYPWTPNGPEGSGIGMDFQILDSAFDSFMATIDFGDGSSVGPMPVYHSFYELHTYANSGTYTVTVTVTDEDGATGTFTFPVNVWNTPPWVADVWGDAGFEGAMSTFEGWFWDVGAETGWTAMADFGDGTGLQPVTVTPGPYGDHRLELNHVYANDGYYMVTTYVTDADGGVGMNVSWVRIENVDPQVTLPEWASLDEGSPFTASGSFVDPGVDTWTATIDYGDGSPLETLELEGKTFQLSHVYTRPGSYWVNVTIWDGNENWGGYGYAGTYVEVRNVLPVVTVEGGTIARGAVFTSSGSFTDPGEGEWYVSVDYGDGTDSEGMFPEEKTFQLSHLYEQPGTYTVTVSVWDWSDVVTTTVQVVVVSPPPVVSLEGASISEGEWLMLQGSFSTSAHQVTATVDYGDGLGEQPLSLQGTTFTLGHVYMDNGTYPVTVRILDEHGGLGTATALVVVNNAAPTVTVSAVAPQYWGLPVSFSGTVTDPSGPDTAAGFSTSWAFGDGSTGSGLSTARTYSAPGSYVAVLTATDKDGASASAAVPVEIQQRPSSLTCDDSLAVYGFPISLSAQLADALPGAQLGGRRLAFRVGASMDLGSSTTGSDGSGSVPSPGSLEPGHYTVTVSFAGDSHYTGVLATCELTVTGSDGQLHGGGLRLANGSRGGFSVKVNEDGVLDGVLRFKSATTSFHAHTVTALGISPDRLSGWFAGTGEDGRSFQAYVEDHGDAGTSDVFKLWIDGVLVTGDGLLTGGNLRIHREPIALAP